jgi:hypothetical protein
MDYLLSKTLAAGDCIKELKQRMMVIGGNCIGELKQRMMVIGFLLREISWLI